MEPESALLGVVAVLLTLAILLHCYYNNKLGGRFMSDGTYDDQGDQDQDFTDKLESWEITKTQGMPTLNRYLFNIANYTNSLIRTRH